MITLIALNVDKDPDQPGLFAGRTGWHRSQGFRRSQEGFLYQVMRVVGARREPPRKTVQAILVGLEERGQPFVAIVSHGIGRQRDRRISAHTVIDVPGLDCFDSRSLRVICHENTLRQAQGRGLW